MAIYNITVKSDAEEQLGWLESEADCLRKPAVL